MFYGTPSPENEKAQQLYRQNRFSVTRQLRYSQDETALALDLGLFINGLPIATFELKNSLTKQTVDDAVEQYKRDRNPREKAVRAGALPGALRGGRTRGEVLHAAARQGLVVPAVQPGWNDGAGNPPNPNGLKDGLPVEAGADAGQPDEHHRELRADRGVEGPEDRKQETHADLAAVSPAGGGAPAAGRRSRERRGEDVPDSALGGQREVELDCVAWRTS